MAGEKRKMQEVMRHADASKCRAGVVVKRNGGKDLQDRATDTRRGAQEVRGTRFIVGWCKLPVIPQVCWRQYRNRRGEWNLEKRIREAGALWRRQSVENEMYGDGLNCINSDCSQNICDSQKRSPVRFDGGTSEPRWGAFAVGGREEQDVTSCGDAAPSFLLLVIAQFASRRTTWTCTRIHCWTS